MAKVYQTYEGWWEIRANSEDVFSLVGIPLLATVVSLTEVGICAVGFRFARGAGRFAFGVAGAVSLVVTLFVADSGLVLFTKFE